MTKTEPTDADRERARVVVKAVVSDLSDRRGLKWEWEDIGDDIKQGILSVWCGIVAAELAAVREEEAQKQREFQCKILAQTIKDLTEREKPLVEALKRLSSYETFTVAMVGNINDSPYGRECKAMMDYAGAALKAAGYEEGK